MLEFLKSVNPLIWLISGGFLFLCGLALAISLIIKRKKPQKVMQPASVIMSTIEQPDFTGASVLDTISNRRASVSSIIGNRSYQQDYAITYDEELPAEMLAQKGRLAIMCDGMGGMQGGERASRCCAELLIRSYYSEPFASPSAFYSAQIPKADDAVHTLENAQGELLGGGTTLVAAIVKEGRAYCASVGDSRIYLFRAGELIQLTRDHNYFLTLSQMVREGEITMEDAMANPQREALISYVGMGTGPDVIDIDEQGFPVGSGDLLLLCSDGLYKAMSQEEIRQVIADHADDLQALPEILTATAFSKGWITHDNITAVVMSCEP